MGGTETRWRIGPLAAVASLALLAGCAELGPAAVAATPGAGERCTLTVDRDRPADPARGRLTTIQEAVDRARPGSAICVASLDHGDERVEIRTSGTAGAPVRILALGPTRTGGFVVEADHVEIAGFRIGPWRGPRSGDGRGIHLAGRGLTVTDNTVVDPAGDGIGCAYDAPGCPDAVIARNRVAGADGTGIVVRGERILVAGNDVSGSRMETAGDADGIRFFGRQITIRGNYVHDISDAGFPDGQEPHTDCFQTFDHHKPATSDVVIEDNVCLDVDHQCLIVEAPVRRQSARIVFRRNLCANRGSQGVLVRDVPGVEITGNLFMPSIVHFGAAIRQKATGAAITGNIFAGDYRPYQVDASSHPGLVADGNLVAHGRSPVPPDWWREPGGTWRATPAGDDALERALAAWRRDRGVTCGSAAEDVSGRDWNPADRAVAMLLCSGGARSIAG